MRTIKKIKPGLPGTKGLLKKYGDDLICVRYRNDFKRNKRLKTIELIYDEKPLVIDSNKIPMNKIMNIKVEYGEKKLGILLRNAGGRWDRKNKVWKLPYKEVLELGLEKRIVT